MCLSVRIDLPDDDGEGAWLHDPAGVGPNLFLQQVPEPKVGKVRLHMDVRVAGSGTAAERWAAVQAAVARLTAAGGTVVWEDAQRHVVMADPEGHEFCVC